MHTVANVELYELCSRLLTPRRCHHTVRVHCWYSTTIWYGEASAMKRPESDHTSGGVVSDLSVDTVIS
jgi:hypothetical protein